MHGVPHERRDPVGRTAHPHADRAGRFRSAYGLGSPSGAARPTITIGVSVVSVVSWSGSGQGSLLVTA